MRKVLLVEDNSELRELVTKFLAADHVFQAGSVEDARAHIESGTAFDVAIIDFWLYEKDAISILDDIKEKLPGLPVILISGGGHGIALEITVAAAGISGYSVFLQKPFSKSELLGAIESFLTSS